MMNDEFNNKDKLIPTTMTVSNNSPSEPLKILIVDDDPDIHEFIKAVLSDFNYEGKSLSLLSAYSAPQATQLIADHPDLAVILLDVMMEENESGLVLIKLLRETLKNYLIRIIICTSNRSFTTEKDIILNYHINDYLVKTELNPGTLFGAIVMAVRSFENLQEIESKKQELQNMIDASGRFIPKSFLKLLNKDSITEIKLSDYSEKQVSILYISIQSFSSIAEFSAPFAMFTLLNECMAYIEPTIVKHNGFINKCMGDAILALFPESADEALSAAIELLKVIEEYSYQRILKQQVPIEIGIGINTGTVVVGVIGFDDRTECTVIGDAVNLAESIEEFNNPFDSKLLIGGNTFRSLNHPENYNHRLLGNLKVPNKKNDVAIYEIYNNNPTDVVLLKKETQGNFDKALQYFQAEDYASAKKIFEEILKRNSQDHTVKYFLKLIKKYSD